jgi:superfamily II DNA/RNA helicase
MPQKSFSKGTRRPFGGRPSFNSRPNFRSNRGGFKKRPITSIDPMRYVNKAVIVETPVPYVATHRFADFQIEESLKTNIITKGYVTPTPIQDQAIPHILTGKDVVGIANTGTGKTAAFLIPIINKLLKDRTQRTIIMVPTRELATQINDEFRGFATGLKLYSSVCVGGASMGLQLRELSRRPQVVIGTPGRLKDLLERRALNLSDFKIAVLDEADRMLDMGFINDMRKILSLLPEPRHTLFFSATLSPEIEKLIHEFLSVPVRISLAVRQTSSSIEQDVVRVENGKEKIEVLHDLLTKPGFDKVLIFGRTKHGVERLSKTLIMKGFKAESIHGDKTQGRRQRALDLFKKDHVQILVATDVAARGLDINGVSHVINYDLPATHEDYVHRIGRTGRAGKKGIALTFV